MKPTIPRGQVLIHQSAEPNQGAAGLSRHSQLTHVMALVLVWPKKKMFSAGTVKEILITELLGKELWSFLAAFGISADSLPLLMGKLSMVT